ncbi:MAG: XkdW family protein [Gammaproteobacteria bacterium]
MVDQGILGILGIILLGVCGWVFIIWQNARRTHEQIRDIVQQQNMVRTDMSARELCHAVHLIHPDAHIGIDYIIGHDSTGQDAYLAEWHADAPKPTAKDLQDALAKLPEGGMLSNYAALRRAEYPSIGDQLDAAYKARQGDVSAEIELDKKIREVKDKYPKTDVCT